MKTVELPNDSDSLKAGVYFAIKGKKVHVILLLPRLAHICSTITCQLVKLERCSNPLKMRQIADCIVLSNVVTPTRKALEFKHASQ